MDEQDLLKLEASTKYAYASLAGTAAGATGKSTLLPNLYYKVQIAQIPKLPAQNRKAPPHARPTYPAKAFLDANSSSNETEQHESGGSTTLPGIEMAALWLRLRSSVERQESGIGHLGTSGGANNEGLDGAGDYTLDLSRLGAGVFETHDPEGSGNVPSGVFREVRTGAVIWNRLTFGLAVLIFYVTLLAYRQILHDELKTKRLKPLHGLSRPNGPHGALFCLVLGARCVEL